MWPGKTEKRECELGQEITKERGKKTREERGTGQRKRKEKGPPVETPWNRSCVGKIAEKNEKSGRKGKEKPP